MLSGRGVSLVSAGGMTPELFLLLPSQTALLVPAVVEFALVAIGPFGCHVVWGGVGSAGRPVHKERLVRCNGLLLGDPGHAAVGDRLGEVPAGLVGWLDRGGGASYIGVCH